MSSMVPPMPVFDAYARKLGSGYVLCRYFDDEMNPTANCPDDLRHEYEHLDEDPESEWIDPFTQPELFRSVDGL